MNKYDPLTSLLIKYFTNIKKLFKSGAIINKKLSINKINKSFNEKISKLIGTKQIYVVYEPYSFNAYSYYISLDNCKTIEDFMKLVKIFKEKKFYKLENKTLKINKKLKFIISIFFGIELVNALKPEELTAIFYHELGHIIYNAEIDTDKMLIFFQKMFLLDNIRKLMQDDILKMPSYILSIPEYLENIYEALNFLIKVKFIPKYNKNPDKVIKKYFEENSHLLSFSICL